MAATADISVVVNPAQAFRAFEDWGRLQQIRGKSSEATLKKLMKFWISFALFKIHAADPAAIEANLMRLSNNSSKLMIRSRRRRTAAPQNRFGKLGDKYRGTVAAAIIAAINYKGVRNASRVGSKKRVVGDGAAFYAEVPKFIRARKFSARLHKAGFYPAISALKIGGAGRVPKYKATPGTYKENVEKLAATLVAENFASAKGAPGRPAKGIVGHAPDCLSAAEKEVGALLEKWLAKDLMDAAHGSGFAALSAA